MTAGVAEARTEILRWTHPEAGEVVSWEANIGSSQGSYDQVIPLTNPQRGSDGVFQASIEVADDADVFVTVRAIGEEGQRSPRSNERARSAGASGPPPSAPLEPPTLIQIVPVDS
jgi:hypothetical protein